jgi:hypothetical protein
MMGGLIQLISGALEGLEEIYRVRGNCEFSELLQLSLFSFDKVSALLTNY